MLPVSVRLFCLLLVPIIFIQSAAWAAPRPCEQVASAERDLKKAVVSSVQSKIP